MWTGRDSYAKGFKSIRLSHLVLQDLWSMWKRHPNGYSQKKIIELAGFLSKVTILNERTHYGFCLALLSSLAHIFYTNSSNMIHWCGDLLIQRPKCVTLCARAWLSQQELVWSRMSQQKWQQQQQRQQQQRRRRQMMYEWARQQENKRRPPSRMFSCSVCGKGPVQFCPYCRKLFCRSHLPRLTQDSQLRFVGHYCRPRKSMGRASPSSPSSKIQSGVERRLINPVAIGQGSWITASN